MQNDAIGDLYLAGVRWELTDIPMTVAAANAAAAAEMAKNATVAADSSAPSDATATVSEIAPMMRVATSVVPPIAPIASVSIDTANAMAARPTDMESLSRMIGEFNHPLRSAASNVVLPHVAKNPNGLVIITDIPSTDDDAAGQILTGSAGELLDKMLAAIEMSRATVSIIPTVFWRTPGGRTPSRAELDLARPFTNRAIELLQPRVILTLGTLPASEFAGVTLPKGHGIAVTLPNGVQCMPIFHPNYLMLKPTAKRDAWNALQVVQNMLKSN